jgi:DNA-binding NtrC family response regulator
MESDLFGHVRGAFSGASENKRGLVEQADGGTAFFDEIGDLPLEMQVKLLRLVQESEIRPVGGLQWHKVNIRIIAATHRDLKAEVAAGRFRLDLYYRLNVFAMRLPPLRERIGDIPLLVEHFLESSRAKGMPAMDLSEEWLDAFRSYDWPGNVRELKHCIERLSAMQSENGPQFEDLPTALRYVPAAKAASALSRDQFESPAVPGFRLTPPSPVISLPESERRTITHALQATGGERGKTARMLGIGRTTLYRKMKQYGIA